MADDKIAKTAEQGLASMEMPDFLKDQGAVGTEHLTKDDVQMPRIMIAQQMSPELAPEKPNYNEDLKVGQMFNSLTSHIYGKGPLMFTVLRADPPRWVEFVPRELGGGVKDPRVPFGDPRTNWGDDGKPPIATKFYDFIIRLLPSGEVVALSFKSTGLKVARQLNGLMAARQKPIYAGTYYLSSISTTNAKGSFYIPMVKNAGWVTPELLVEGEQLFQSLKEKVIDIHTVDDTEAGDTSFNPEELERTPPEVSGM